MKITPRGKRVLILKDELGSKESEFGIVTPDSVEQEQKAYGTVVSVSPEIKDLKKGDRVIYTVFGGDPVNDVVKGKKVEYLLCHDDDVIAFI